MRQTILEKISAKSYAILMKDIIPHIQEALLKPKQHGHNEKHIRDIIIRFMKTKD